jgi:hypothetical protein
MGKVATGNRYVVFEQAVQGCLGVAAALLIIVGLN